MSAFVATDARLQAAGTNPAPSAELRLLLAADRPIFREGLRRVFEAEPGFQVIGEASDIATAIRFAQTRPPDVVLLDVDMPGVPELKAMQTLVTSLTQCRIVLLTVAIERAHIVDALRCGVRGVLTKESTTDLLFKSIRCVMAGQYWVGPESISDLIQYICQPPPAGDGTRSKRTFGLTRRELQIVATVANGYTNKDIARHFSLSEDTVKHHVSHIFDKVGVSNRLELALFAVHHGLTDTP